MHSRIVLNLYYIVCNAYFLAFNFYSLVFKLCSLVFNLYSRVSNLYSVVLFNLYSLEFNLYSVILFNLYSLVFNLYSVMLFNLYSLYVICIPSYLICICINLTSFLSKTSYHLCTLARPTRPRGSCLHQTGIDNVRNLLGDAYAMGYGTFCHRSGCAALWLQHSF